MAEEFGFRYTETPNQPLAHKHNLNLRATRDLDWDYAWLLGSDTLVTPGIFTLYQPTLSQRPHWCGLRDLYFYETAKRRFLYWPGYDQPVRGQRRIRPDSVGAGRMFSRETVEHADWQLWKPHIKRGLDWNSFLRLTGMFSRPETHLRHWAEDRVSGPHTEHLLELRTDIQVTNLAYFRRLVELPIPAPIADLLEGTPWHRHPIAPAS
jgi:hypothetical protein